MKKKTIFVVALFFFFSSTPLVSATKEIDVCKTRFKTEDAGLCVLRMREAGYYFVDPFDSGGSTCDLTEADTSIRAGSIKTLYMIGDSITEGAKNELQSTFEEQKINAVIDGKASRALTSGDKPTDGLSVLEEAQDIYKDVDAIVIALGTNGGYTPDSINTVLDYLKNSNTKFIFWVNVGVNNDKRDDTDINYIEVNKVLETTSQTYTIIDWATIVESQPSVIGDDGYGVHPTVEGRKTYAKTVVDGIIGGVQTPGCSPSVLRGEDNAQKVWNYMKEKGLEDHQIAGFMGNMQAEAGFEPRRLEYAYSDPPNLSDTVPDCANEKCQPGWGIVQWTAKTRKNGLKAFIESMGGSPTQNEDTDYVLLSLQLEYVWKEIEGACCVLKDSFKVKYGENATVLEALKQTETIEDATDLILRNYEIPGDMDKAYRVRIGFAQSWYAKYGVGGVANE